MTDSGTLNLAWAQLIVEELRRAGIGHFGVAPGSRSSALALAVAANDRVRATVHFDERGLAYHAIGYIRGSGQPAAVICTSGTAVANFFPAIVEAAQDSLPLVVLTADRPPELRDCGANQTINQTRIYGEYVRCFVDLPCPDPSTDPTRVLRLVDEAIQAALTAPRGPIHLNCPYREPLLPKDEEPPVHLTGLTGWYESGMPHTPIQTIPAAPAAERLASLLEQVQGARRGLLVVGQLRGEGEKSAVAQAAVKLGWPTLTDITSGLRPSKAELLHGPHDLLLRNERFRSQVRPDLIVHLGGQLVSKHLLAFLGERRGTTHWTCPGGFRRFDPAHTVTDLLPGDLTAVADALGACPLAPLDPNYRHLWKTAFDTVERITDSLSEETSLDECTMAHRIARLGDGHDFFLAGSLTIRDFDWFAPRRGGIGVAAANRGASGIDGTLASAVGMAHGLNRPVTLVIGDLALLHDLNSLSLVTASTCPVSVVVVNNHGGRIFETLPVAKRRAHFDRFFAAEHDRSFEHAAAMFGLPWAKVTTSATLVDACRASRHGGQSCIIEADIAHAEATRRRRALFERIDHHLNEL